MNDLHRFIPLQVLFLNEKEDFIHGGILYKDTIIDLTDGDTYLMDDPNIEIKSTHEWKDLEEAAFGDEMAYYADSTSNSNNIDVFILKPSNCKWRPNAAEQIAQKIMETIHEDMTDDR